MQYLIENKLDPKPFVEMLFATDLMFSMIDERAVAKAVYHEATIEEIHGKKLFNNR